MTLPRFWIRAIAIDNQRSRVGAEILYKWVLNYSLELGNGDILLMYIVRGRVESLMEHSYYVLYLFDLISKVNLNYVT